MPIYLKFFDNFSLFKRKLRLLHICILLFFSSVLLLTGCSSATSSSQQSSNSQGQIGIQLVEHPFFSHSLDNLKQQEPLNKDTAERIELDFYQLKDGIPGKSHFSRSLDINSSQTEVSISGVPSCEYEIVGRIYKNNKTLPYSKFKASVYVENGKDTRCTAVLTSALLRSIELSYDNVSIPKGYSQQLKATGIFSDNTKEDITSYIDWSSSNVEICNISGEKGNVSAITSGNAVVTATDPAGDISASANVTVTDEPILQTIALEPNITSIPLGLTQSYKAIGYFNGNITKDLSNDVSWSVTDSTVLSLNDTVPGTVKALAVGSCTLSALDKLTNIKGDLNINVTDAQLISIDVTPSSVSLPKGITQQFTAIGKYSDDTTLDITSKCLWSSSDPAIVSVDNTVSGKGKALTISSGKAFVNVEYTNRSETDNSVIKGSASVFVTDVYLKSITIAPSNTTVTVGNTTDFSLSGNYSDGTTQDLTKDALWSSSQEKVASISNTEPTIGLAKGVSVGGTTISAVYTSFTASSQLTVSPSKTISSITVTPAVRVLPVGQSLQFTANVLYSNGTTEDITSNASWSCADSTIASASSVTPGLINALVMGSTTVTAAYSNFTGSASLTVDNFGFNLNNSYVPTTIGTLSAKVVYAHDDDPTKLTMTVVPTVAGNTLFVPLYDSVSTTKTIIYSVTFYNEPTGGTKFAFEWWNKATGLEIDLATVESDSTTTNLFAGGTGVESAPYLVANPRHLNNVRNKRTSFFLQVSDIDFEGACGMTGVVSDPDTNEIVFTNVNTEAPYYNTGSGWSPIGTLNAFRGYYNGDNNKILNLMANTKAFYCGIFSQVDWTVHASKVALANIVIDSSCYFVYEAFGNRASSGSVCGNIQCNIENCINHGSVYLINSESFPHAESYVGGIVGYAYGSISKCKNTGSVGGKGTGSLYGGGIVGRYLGDNFTSPDSISNCSNFGNIVLNGLEYSSHTGGIIGYCYVDTNVEHCVNNGNIIGNNPYNETYSGGIAGYMHGLTSVSYCRNNGNIRGNYAVGGICGYTCGSDRNYPKISFCCNTGKIYSDENCTPVHFGGISGYCFSFGSINNCFNIGNIYSVLTQNSVTNCLGGIAGYRGYPSSYIRNCYSIGEVEGKATTCKVGAISGTSYSSPVTNCFYVKNRTKCNDVITNVGIYGETEVEANTKMLDSESQVCNVDPISVNGGTPTLLTNLLGATNWVTNNGEDSSFPTGYSILKALLPTP